MGRLNPGVTPQQAQAEMDVITRGLEEQFPAINTGRGVRVAALHEQIVGEARPALLLLLGTVGLVLLVACANVANMLLARGEDRRREFAVRAALGAGRGRLVGQLLMESGVLALLGAGIGVLLALWALDTLVAAFPREVPRAQSVALDGRVLCFTLVIALVTSLVFGLAPALRASRLDLHTALKEGGRTSGGTGRDRLRGIFVVSQMSVALVLLVGAGLFMRSFQRLIAVDPGFRPENVLSFQLSIPRSSFADPSKRADIYGQVLARLERLPGVQSVGASTNLPLHPAYATDRFVIQGRPQPAPGEVPIARYDSISSRYFQTLGVPLLRGRFFTEQDTIGRPGVLIINEMMARRYWPDEDPIGQQVMMGAQLNGGSPGLFEIVGIVGDQHDTHLSAEFEPYMYVPYRQQTLRFMCFTLRTTVDPLSLVGPVRKGVAAIICKEAPFEFMSMNQLLQRSVAAPLRITLVLGVFAVVALGLGALGIYGAISYLVVRRTHEIGVRMALGAQRADVLRFVLKQGLRLTAIGLGIGLAVSLASTRILSNQLYEISAADPVTFIGVSLLLGASAMLACYMPARRATKVDPMVALRYE